MLRVDAVRPRHQFPRTRSSRIGPPVRSASFAGSPGLLGSLPYRQWASLPRWNLFRRPLVSWRLVVDPVFAIARRTRSVSRNPPSGFDAEETRIGDFKLDWVEGFSFSKRVTGQASVIPMMANRRPGFDLRGNRPVHRSMAATEAGSELQFLFTLDGSFQNSRTRPTLNHPGERDERSRDWKPESGLGRSRRSAARRAMMHPTLARPA